MKLLVKYNRLTITASIVIFLVGCVAFYFMLHFVLLKQLDKTLYSEYTEIAQYAQEHDTLPEIVNSYDQHVSFRESATVFKKPVYSSTKTWIEPDNDKEWARNLDFTIMLKGRQYTVTVTKSQVETEDLVTLIGWLAVSMIALILVAGFIINRFTFKKLWQPFYHTLQSINQYSLTKHQPLQLPITNIEEFALLNSSLTAMAQKIEKDYQALKEFTGNAAHEMQTPLAVIAGEAEALMQDTVVMQQHHRSIAVIDNSVSRLSRLNHSLLLLTKLDNKIFTLNEEVQWQEIIQQKIAALAELTASEEITITVDAVPVTTLFDSHLADIITGNLLSNAIRYNYPGGTIAIRLDTEKLVIRNSSKLPALDPLKTGNRFYRHPLTEADGNGLGLSIVKQVCEMAGYKFDYCFTDGLHQFTIFFTS